MTNQWTQHNFGSVNGTEIIETVMENENGMRVKTCSFGAILTALEVADRQGTVENVVCGFSTVDGYIENPQYFGATIGPFAGRIENGELNVDGELFKVPSNEGDNLLHGGTDAFHQCIWNVNVTCKDESVTTTYMLHYKGAYPGEMDVQIAYTLHANNTLEIGYYATSSTDTLLNLTNHSYFNLSGNLKETIHHHHLTVPADFYVPLTEDGLPKGQYEAVSDSAFDFRTSKLLGEVLGNDAQSFGETSKQQLAIAGDGIDHPFILTDGVIELAHEASGRVLTITSEDKAVVVYTGNKIGTDFAFPEAPAQNYIGVCLEEQNVPNSSKYPNFPSSLLKAGETYSKKALYQFSVK